MRRMVAVSLAMFSVAATIEAPQAVASAPLIPRTSLLASSDREDPKLSPDGKYYSFSAPQASQMRPWVSRTDAGAKARALGGGVGKVTGSLWTASGHELLYTEAESSGQYRVLIADARTGVTRLLLEGKNRPTLLRVSHKRPGVVALTLLEDGAKWPDLYLLALDGGKLSLAYRNSSFSDFVLDDELRAVAGTNRAENGTTAVYALTRSGGHRLLSSLPPDDYQRASVLGANSFGDRVYLLTARNRDTAALVSLDLSSDRQSVLGSDRRGDVDRVFLDPRSGRPLMYLVQYASFEWRPLDRSVRSDIDFLNKNMPGYWSPLDSSADSSKWLIYDDGLDRASSYDVYDRRQHSITRLYSDTPGLKNFRLRRTQAITFRARDGLPLVAYLTLPKRPALAPAKVSTPMVVLIHGGPWGRAYHRLYFQHQWLANRGYAVLDIQFRGSTGFGRRFMEASYREWGAKMQTDIYDGVQWAIGQGIADPKRIALVGRSYGGYSALMALVQRPTDFACAVDFSGVTNVPSFIETAESAEESWHVMIGDPRVASERAKLEKRSPLFGVRQIKRPILVIQGGADKNVRKVDTDRFVAALTPAKKPLFTYVVYPDEGHFIQDPKNDLSSYAIAEGFLSRCLGGGFQPLGKDLNGAKLQVSGDLSLIPGLKATLAATHYSIDGTLR